MSFSSHILSFVPGSAAAQISLIVQLLSPLPPDEETALLQACSLAHQSGECLAVNEAEAQDTLQATVEFTSSTKVLLELNDTHPWRSLYASRELHFREQDNAKERAKAIGIALGVLATSLTQGQTAPSASSTQEEEESDKQRPIEKAGEEPPTSDRALESALPRRKDQPRWLELLGSVGAEYCPSWPSGGPAADVGARALPTDNFGGSLDLQVARLLGQPQDPSLTVFTLSAGPTLRFASRRWSTWIDLHGGAAWLQARLGNNSAPEPVGARVTPVVRLRWVGGTALS